ncbi:hypothetical protein [Methylobacterium sp. E-066]|uniref:hypothetical protein n=1 Tax=Methylobacterium sp. E-066 TaxID=2836584 RepID=UPI001FB9822B|nr:hypothetical protein [Methylobacterium sp. E-066]MCJ2139576.1 hypothetical protein [Methylobacterium sp. E-066]
MAHAYTVRKYDDRNQTDGLTSLFVFVPCLIVWTIGVIFMLPITILAFPVQYFFEHKPKLQGNIVTGLMILGAANAVVTPLSIFYVYCT